MSTEDTSTYEFRFYDVAHGRLAQEVARMHDVAITGEPRPGDDQLRPSRSMFDRHGIPRPLGAWIGISGPRQPLFGYILKWESLAKRDASFPAFWADPLWQSIRNQTDDGIALVERTEDWLMQPSPAWDAVRSRSGAQPVHPEFHELLIQRVENGYLGPAAEAMTQGLLPLLMDRGGMVLGVFEVVIGPDMPALVTFLAWLDQKTQEEAWRQLHVDTRLRDMHQSERQAYGRLLVRSRERYLLQPVSFGMPAANFGRA